MDAGEEYPFLGEVQERGVIAESGMFIRSGECFVVADHWKMYLHGVR